MCRRQLSNRVKKRRMVAPDEEARWIERSQQGDPEAFEQLIASYQRMIHALTYRMTGSLDDAEDLAQETFIHAFQQLGTYRAEAQFSSWIYRIAVNLCLNWRKRVRRRDQMHHEWGQLTIAEGPSSDDRAQRVQEALLQLPPKQRAAVALTTGQGLSHGEAARVLGCSETTVSWRLFAARAKLKRLLKDLAPSSGGPA
jgi:RNA polymerase sigma-70 factor, ECF subfamily